MYRNLYRRLGMESRLLSRTLRGFRVGDIGHNTMEFMRRHTVDGARSTGSYLYTLLRIQLCIAPIMSLLVAWSGFKIKEAAGSIYNSAGRRMAS